MSCVFPKSLQYISSLVQPLSSGFWSLAASDVFMNATVIFTDVVSVGTLIVRPTPNIAAAPLSIIVLFVF